MQHNMEVRVPLAAKKAERAALDLAPCSHAESRAVLSAWCEAQAAAGDEQVSYRVAGVAYGGALMDLLRVRPSPGGMVDLAPVLASVLGAEALTAALWRHLAGSENGPTADERAQRTANLDAEIFELELQDETLVLASETAGRPIPRRPDADPRAVIGLDGEGLSACRVPAVPVATLEPKARARTTKSEYVARRRE